MKELWRSFNTLERAQVIAAAILGSIGFWLLLIITISALGRYGPHTALRWPGGQNGQLPLPTPRVTEHGVCTAPRREGRRWKRPRG